MIKVDSGTFTMEGKLLVLKIEMTIALLGFWRQVRERVGESAADKVFDEIVQSARRQDYRELILEEETEVIEKCLKCGDPRIEPLKSVSTKQLVAELTKRAGVVTEYIEPHTEKTFTESGSMILLKVTD